MDAERLALEERAKKVCGAVWLATNAETAQDVADIIRGLLAQLQAAQEREAKLREALLKSFTHRTDWDTHYCGVCLYPDVSVNEPLCHFTGCIAAALSLAPTKKEKELAALRRAVEAAKPLLFHTASAWDRYNCDPSRCPKCLVDAVLRQSPEDVKA